MAFNKKDKIQIGIIAVLLVVMIYKLPSFMQWLQPGPQARIEPASQSVTSPTKQESNFLQGLMVKMQGTDGEPINETNLELKRTEQKKLAKKPWGRDPFYSIPIDEMSAVNRGGTDQDHLVLTAISLKGNQAMAILNQTVVREGDEIFGVTVGAIQRDQVILHENGQERVLRLGGAK